MPGERTKQYHLLRFLDHLHGRAEALYVVGDLFDFWFDYTSVVPRRGGRVLAALADLVDDGVPVVVFAGNHDWWIGRSLVEEYGLTLRHDPLWLEAQGRRLYIAHGDGLSVPNRRYSFVCRIIRSSTAIRAFRHLHPDVGAFLARHVAHKSGERSTAETPQLQRVPVFSRVCADVFRQGADLALFGHVHAAELQATDAGTLVVLGDWIRLGTYGELTDGAFRLKTWRAPEPAPFSPPGWVDGDAKVF